MKTPSIEEVKDYFKDALEIKCIADKLPYNIATLKLVQNNELGDKFYSFDDENDSENYCVCFTKEKGYAKIISQKNEYKITKEQILKLHNHEGSKYVQEWFPECFKKELIVGRWYKSLDEDCEALFYLEEINNDKTNGMISYGFDRSRKWSESIGRSNSFFYERTAEATPKEIEEALIKEAKKRRYEKGTLCNNSNIHDSRYQDNKLGVGYFEFKDGNLIWSTDDVSFYTIFQNGTWATIINKKKMTISEIEEKLGFEIEIV